MYYDAQEEQHSQPITPAWQKFSEPPPSAMGDLSQLPPWVDTAWSIASIAAGAAGAYHGYKRSPRHPVWGALGYALLGSALPIIGIPVMLAQGFGKQKGR